MRAHPNLVHSRDSEDVGHPRQQVLYHVGCTLCRGDGGETGGERRGREGGRQGREEGREGGEGGRETGGRETEEGEREGDGGGRREGDRGGRGGGREGGREGGRRGEGNYCQHASYTTTAISRLYSKPCTSYWNQTMGNRTTCTCM